MTIPASVSPQVAPPTRAAACEWSALDAAGKRKRLLQAAGETFASQGLDASMPTVAAAAGAGVASVYRQFPSKRDLLAALVVERLDEIAAAAGVAFSSHTDHFSALVEMLWMIVERQSGDDLLGDPRIAVADHPDVRRATDHATRELERLLAAARAEGRLRADATTFDLQLLFAATRAAKQLDPAGWRRMLKLLIEALEGPAVRS